jgi:hypothetical protein
MNNLSLKKFLLLVFTFSLLVGTCNAQIFHKNPEKALFGKSLGNKKEVKVKEPRKVRKAKKKQDAKEKKLNKDKKKSIKSSQNRTMEIQTADVKKRMKQNKKDIDARDKAKKGNVKASTRKAGRKYK